MALNRVRVKSAPGRRRRKLSAGSFYWLIPLFIVTAAVGTFGYDFFYGRLGLIGPQPIIEGQLGGRIIRVPPGGNVQAAIEMAESGDVVELQAGAVYSGTVNLPNKPLTQFVTIRSSAASQLPEGKRVAPAQRHLMATINAGMLGRPAVSAAKGAHHYRFVGIEFTTASSMYNYGLIQLGTGEAAERLPHTIEIDRSYVHPGNAGKTRHGIALNSANTTVTNSYIAGFGFAGEETQGICGWTGTRAVRIVNNYIEGGAENIMFGGADPESADLIPSDIEVVGNHLNKPDAWKQGVSVKTLFELKNAKRVRFTGNRLTNNWKGSAFRITVRNQDNAAPFSIIEDVLISGNVVDGSGDGINILGKDDLYPSRTLSGLRIENNLFLNISGDRGFEGGGYFIQVSDGEKITIANNTAFNTGNTTTFHGVMPRALIIRDNIFGHGNYGVHGVDRRTPMAEAMFRNNVFLNLNAVPDSEYSFPRGNQVTASLTDAGFLAPDNSDYRLGPQSRFRGRATDGGDPGNRLDLTAILR